MLYDSSILEEVFNGSILGITNKTLTKKDTCIVSDKEIRFEIGD